MANATEKSGEIEQVLEDMFGFNRKETINENKCVPAPIGCGKDIDLSSEFTDELSRKEYSISGLCQTCQNSIFTTSPEDEEGITIASETICPDCEEAECLCVPTAS